MPRYLKNRYIQTNDSFKPRHDFVYGGNLISVDGTVKKNLSINNSYPVAKLNFTSIGQGMMSENYIQRDDINIINFLNSYMKKRDLILVTTESALSFKKILLGNNYIISLISDGTTSKIYFQLYKNNNGILEVIREIDTGISSTLLNINDDALFNKVISPHFLYNNNNRVYFHVTKNDGTSVTGWWDLETDIVTKYDYEVTKLLFFDDTNKKLYYEKDNQIYYYLETDATVHATGINTTSTCGNNFGVLYQATSASIIFRDKNLVNTWDLTQALVNGLMIADGEIGVEALGILDYDNVNKTLKIVMRRTIGDFNVFIANISVSSTSEITASQLGRFQWNESPFSDNMVNMNYADFDYSCNYLGTDASGNRKYYYHINRNLDLQNTKTKTIDYYDTVKRKYIYKEDK